MATDLDKLQGTWHVTALEADGQKMPPGSLAGARIVIKGGAFASLGMGHTYRGTIELPKATRLKAFDLVFTAGPQKGTRNRGIYRLRGDQWTICLATHGDTRPATFSTKAGSGFALETLTRTAPVAAPAELDSRKKPGKGTAQAGRSDDIVATGPPTDLEGEWQMVAGVLNGAALSPDMVKWCRRITRGSVTAVVAGPQTMVKASFTVNRATQPPSIDYVSLVRATAGDRQAGIYELRGDTLKICMAAAGQPRPSDFSSKPRDGRSYTTWRRSKP